MKKVSSHLRNSEQGFASIIIAITLVIITSLIVIGFARLARTEQTQVTNRQLSNQAYYAAESGINDAAKALSKGYTQKKEKCGPLQLGDPGYLTTGGEALRNNNVDATPASEPDAPIEWTCLLIDPAPSTLEYSPVDTVTPKLFKFSGVGTDGTTPTAVNRITFSWQDSDPNITNFRTVSGISNTAFPPLGSWNSVGMLRVSITPLGSLNRADLKSRTYTAFLYPSTSPSTTAAHNTGSSTNGAILNGGCSSANTPRFCSASITLAGYLPTEEFLVSMRSIYAKTSVSIQLNSGNARASGAQAMIDSTGRSQDVLKRLQVRIPSRNEFFYPGFAAEASGDICKELEVYPGYAKGCGY